MRIPVVERPSLLRPSHSSIETPCQFRSPLVLAESQSRERFAEPLLDLLPLHCCYPPCLKFCVAPLRNAVKLPPHKTTPPMPQAAKSFNLPPHSQHKSHRPPFMQGIVAQTDLRLRASARGHQDRGMLRPNGFNKIPTQPTQQKNNPPTTAPQRPPHTKKRGRLRPHLKLSANNSAYRTGGLAVPVARLAVCSVFARLFRRTGATYHLNPPQHPCAHSALRFVPFFARLFRRATK